MSSGIPITSGFNYKGKSFLDRRKNIKTLSELLLLRDVDVPEGFVTYLETEDKYYQFKSTNTVDKNTGKWRRVYLSTDEPPKMEGTTLIISK